MKTYSVAIITNIITPYRIPCFNEVAKKSDFKLKVYFMAKMESNRQWNIDFEEINFDYTVLKGFHLSLKEDYELHLNIFFPHFILNRFDVIALGGYDQPILWEALMYAKLFKKKTILFGESTPYDIRKFKSLWIKKAKRFFISKIDYFLPPGRAAEEYFKSLGAPPERIIIAPFSTDHDFFHQQYVRLREKKPQIKREKSYPEITILFVGRLVWYKGIRYLLEAYGKLEKEMSNIGLVLLGDGPMMEECRDFVKRYNLKNVFFQGFIHQKDLPIYYTASDIFVLPSLSETWGIVINEAMEFGLPIITTNRVGAAYDLVKEGINGFIIPAGNTYALYNALKKLCMDKQLRKKMGENSLMLIKNHTPQKWAESFINTVIKALS